MFRETYSRAFLDKLEALHAGVDAEAGPLADRLGDDLVCARGCSACCQDDLTVFTLEAALIRHKCADVLAAGPAPAGACAFLDQDGACRIYRWRPYVCRTQGLPLRWLDADEAGHQIAQTDICPLNLEAMAARGRNLTDLGATDCWNLGPWEGKLASLQAEADGCFDIRRVPLRDLFA